MLPEKLFFSFEEIIVDKNQSISLFKTEDIDVEHSKYLLYSKELEKKLANHFKILSFISLILSNTISFQSNIIFKFSI
jgi:hypothetical protein